MIKFIDTKTGNLYNGLTPYIHWFDGQQSTQLIYTHTICFISNIPTISLSIDSSVFHLLNNSMLNGNYNKYADILWDSANGPLSINGKKIQEDQYLYNIYISASSENSGEYITYLTIHENDADYIIAIGADFYSEHEPTYINLSNLGVELPASIQKTIYGSNIYEYNKDNILMNRKMKELLSNYWDIIANKGNYKSLINSLKWFEWGDLLSIKEIWKRNEFGKIIYNTNELCSLLEDKYNITYRGFCKTTYLALYLAMQTICDNNEWDEEGNPILSELSTEWSKEELSLKLCLLGNFYETYFMPIHQDLIHSTLENIVFTNTIKIINGNFGSRNDYIHQTNSLRCNVKNNQTFVLGNISCQVGRNTMFGRKWNGEVSYDKMTIMGVDEVAVFEEAKNNPITDDELKSFYSQIFSGIGVIVPIECTVDLAQNDFIIESKLYINDDYVIDTRIIKELPIKFNILLQREGEHEIKIQFKTAGSYIYFTKIKVNVIDVSGMKLNAYKVNHYLYNDLRDMMHWTTSINKYQFSRFKNTNDIPIVQYLTTSPGKTTGVALSNVLVLRGDYRNDYDLNQYYYTYLKSVKDENDKITQIYTICICKTYWSDPSQLPFYKELESNIYRNDYGFFPDFHYLIPLTGEEPEDYYIQDGDVVAIIPELPYGMEIEDFDWEFFNVTKNETFKFPYISEPFISPDKEVYMPRGYYNVIFRFRVGEKWHEMKLESVFRKI